MTSKPKLSLVLNQETVDKMKERLTDGKGQCAVPRYPGSLNNTSIVCLYKEPVKGNSCIVGCLFEDDFLEKAGQDHNFIGGVGTLCVDLDIEVAREDLAAFADLQDIHDEEEVWKNGVITEAGKHMFNNVLNKYAPTLVGFELEKDYG